MGQGKGGNWAGGLLSHIRKAVLTPEVLCNFRICIRAFGQFHINFIAWSNWGSNPEWPLDRPMHLVSVQSCRKHAVKHIYTSRRGAGPAQALALIQVRQWSPQVHRSHKGQVWPAQGHFWARGRREGAERGRNRAEGGCSSRSHPTPSLRATAGGSDMHQQFFRHRSKQLCWATCSLPWGKGMFFSC